MRRSIRCLPGWRSGRVRLTRSSGYARSFATREKRPVQDDAAEVIGGATAPLLKTKARDVNRASKRVKICKTFFRKLDLCGAAVDAWMYGFALSLDGTFC